MNGGVIKRKFVLPSFRQTSQDLSKISFYLFNKPTVFNMYMGRHPSLLCHTETETLQENDLQVEFENNTDELEVLSKVTERTIPLVVIGFE